MKRRWLVGLGVFGAFLTVILFSFIMFNGLWPTLLRAQVPSATQDHSITLNDAIIYTSNFRKDAVPGGISGEFFGMDAVRALADQPGTIGIRIYYGKKADGTPVLVLVGVNSGGADMINGLLDERGYPCPPVCDGSSPLSH